MKITRELCTVSFHRPQDAFDPDLAGIVFPAGPGQKTKIMPACNLRPPQKMIFPERHCFCHGKKTKEKKSSYRKENAGRVIWRCVDQKGS
ncbi:MAG: hypothetical protein CSA20_07160 [Deltaproteobacteria bacterium]|nr:MAG: hypothetical protein CSA20_07160 [Deltaproteobacteria bacterium]